MSATLLTDCLGPYDLQHVGQIYQRVRTKRGLKPDEIARLAGVSHTTVSRFEDEFKPTKESEYFDRFVSILTESALNGRTISNPLSSADVTILKSIHSHGRTKKTLLAQQDLLGAIRLSHILSARSTQSLAGLEALLERLKHETRPAFIADPFWFIHAINGAAFNLFGIQPHDSYLNRWEAWHVLGAKFTDNSPVRNHHLNYWEYFPPTIDVFFRSSSSFLFTAQMRVLLHELHRISEKNGLDFTLNWEKTVAFDLHWSERQLHRNIAFVDPSDPHGEPIVIVATANETEVAEVRLAGKRQPVGFWLGIWNGVGKSSKEIIANLPGKINNTDVFFATTYDRLGTFHVNTWPEVEPYVLD